MAYAPEQPLALIAGTGDLPQLMLQARDSAGAVTYIVAIKDQTPPALTAHHPHGWFRIGAVGAILDALRNQGITQIAMAGRITRPSLPQLFPDSEGRALLKMLGGSLLTGDNQLLSRIIAFLEMRGMEVVGAHEIAASLTAQVGILTHPHPHPLHYEDADKAMKLLHAMAAFDVGQAVIMQSGCVIGIEGAEGTHALIERCAPFLTAGERGAVLVKLPKACQDLRADMPSVGAHTVEALVQGGYAGMFIAAGNTLLLGREAMIAQANRDNLFIEAITLSS
jgi:UDP-2,3-diacylglucosamine hydrolase